MYTEPDVVVGFGFLQGMKCYVVTFNNRVV